jgi:hypothetical protein
MSNVIHFSPPGSALAVLYAAAEECKADTTLKPIVILQGDDVADIRVSYSEECNYADVHYALSLAASWQLYPDELPDDAVS